MKKRRASIKLHHGAWCRSSVAVEMELHMLDQRFCGTIRQSMSVHADLMRDMPR
jgi:hypothetical protein